MARPKSDDKRNTILAAAASIFAERGLSAPTAAISTAAGVAEGSLFTYFKSKDDLINALYRQVKLSLAEELMLDFPRRGSVRARLQHVWDHYVDWGIANPVPLAALRKMQVWEGLTCEAQATGMAPFAEIQKMSQDAVAERIFVDLPERFIAAMLTAQAETTMEFMKLEPEQAQMYKTSGFEMFWAGITSKR